MASTYKCVCGNLVRNNLYEGHNLHLLVPEGLTDMTEAEEAQPVGGFLDRLVLESAVVAKCPDCGVLAVISDESGVQHYAPVS